MDTVTVSQISNNVPNPIFIYREEHSGSRIPHRHDFFEICFVLSGAGKQVSLGGEHLIQPNEVLFIPPSAWHGLTTAESLRMEFCCFSMGLFNGELAGILEDPYMQSMLCARRHYRNGIMSLALTEDEFHSCLQLTDAIFTASGGNCCHGNASLLAHPHRIRAYGNQLAYLILLLTRLCDIYEATAPAYVATSTSIIQEVLARMEEKPEFAWTLHSLAEIAFMEPSYFIRRFREETGTSPLRYLFCVRMQAASELLLRTSKPIGQIAEECGIPQPSHFGARFREYFHVSPAEYRRLFRSEPGEEASKDVNRATPLVGLRLQPEVSSARPAKRSASTG